MISYLLLFNMQWLLTQKVTNYTSENSFAKTSTLFRHIFL